MIENEYFPEQALRFVLLLQLRQIRAVQSYFPEEIVKRYGMDPKELDSRIELLKENPSGVYRKGERNNRISFLDVLQECNIEEQTRFLEDHFLEEIPFFFISDILFSWTRLHRHFYLPKDQEGRSTSVKDDVNNLHDGDTCTLFRTPPSSSSVDLERHFTERIKSKPYKDGKNFQSKILCKNLLGKIKDNVIPFDVGVCALAILACSSQKNREFLSGLIIPEDFVQEYENYKKNYSSVQRNTFLESNEYVSTDEISAAMQSLLSALDEGRRSVNHSFVGRVRRILSFH